MSSGTTRNIAKNSDITRPDVYRVLVDLEKLRLIEKTISTPTEYKAVPIEIALDILLGRKQQENKQPSNKANPESKKQLKTI